MQNAASSNVNSPVDSSICPNYMVNVFDVRTVSSLTNTNTKLDSASGYFCAYRPYLCDKTKATNYLPRDVMLDNVPVVCDIYQSAPSSFECFQSNIGNMCYFHRLCLTIMPGSVMSEEVTSDASQPEPIMRSEPRPAFWAPFAFTNFLWFANNAAVYLGRRSICILFYHHVKSSFILCPLACSFGLSF